MVSRALPPLTLGWALLVGAPAWAADAELLGVAPIPADGETASVLRFQADGLSPADSVKIKADGGSVEDLTIGTDGTGTFRLIPDRLEAAGEVPLVIRIKGAGGTTESRATVPVRPADAGPVSLRFDPPAITLGEGSVLVRILPPPGPVSDAEERLLVHASLGTLEAPVQGSGGEWLARWTPPAAIKGSTIVVFTAARASSPEQVAGWAGLPLRLRQSVTFAGPPGSDNVVLHGDQRLGPVTASPAGTFALEVAIDPRSAEATVQSTPKVGKPVEQRVRLSVADSPTHAFVALPPALLADPRRPYRLLIAVAQPNGDPGEEAPRLSASSGSLGSVEETDQDGLFAVEWTPTAEGTKVQFTAEVGGRSVTVERPLVAAPLRISATGAAGKARDSYVVTATVTGTDGRPVKGKAPLLEGTGGTRAGAPKETAPGRFQATFTLAPRSPALRLRAESSALKASGLPPAALLIDPSAEALRPGEVLPMRIVAVDALGLPVPKVTLRLSVPQGDGTVPPTAITNERGVAVISYKAGAGVGLVRLRAEGAGLEVERSLRQGSAPWAAVALGGPLALEASRRWAETAGWLSYDRPPPVVAKARSAAPAAGSAASPWSTPAPAEPIPAEPIPADADADDEAPSARAARAPRSASANEAPWGRIGLRAGSVGMTYTSEGAANLGPKSLSFTAGQLSEGAVQDGLGAGLEAVLWPRGGDWGVELSAQAWRTTGKPGPFNEFDLQRWSARAAARRRFDLGDEAALYVLAGLGRGSAPLFLYGEEALSPSLYTLQGGVVGGGFLLEHGRLGADLRLGELIVPWPVETQASLDLSFAVKERLAAVLDVGLDRTSVTLAQKKDEVAVSDKELRIGLGVDLLLR